MPLLITYLITALSISFLCSILEAVFMSITSPYIAALKARGHRSGQLLHSLRQNIDRSLAAILTLNTIANTVGAAVVGGEVVSLYGEAYLGVASAILTFLILVMTEIVPKTLGATYWRQLAPVSAYILHYLTYLMFPFVMLSFLLTKKIAKQKSLYSFNREEFTAFAELGVQEGQLKAQESKIVGNLLRLRTSTLKDIMTPRTVVFAVPETMTVSEFFAEYSNVSFSRIPVYQQNRDDMSGFALLSDILLAQARDQHQLPLSHFKRELKVLPSSLKLSRLFDFLLHSKYHIVLVVDEYGGIEGIATLEDLVETLLGFEIVDESERIEDLQALARRQGALKAKNLGISIEKKPK